MTASPTARQARDTIPNRFKWDLSHLYAGDDEWRRSKESVAARMEGVGKHKGKLGDSPQALLAALEEAAELRKELTRLDSYARMMSDQDTRVSKYQAMRQEMLQLASAFAALTSWIEPELLAVDRTDQARIGAFLSQEPRLEPFRFHLEDVLRRRDHTGTGGEEKIIADASLMASGPESIYEILANADFPYPAVTLSDGRQIVLDPSTFEVSRASTNRADRRKVFAAFFGALGKYRRTFGAALNANLWSDLFFMRARGYASSLESALDRARIPVSVYKGLIAGIEENLPVFHRYLELRSRVLGVEQLHYYDLYAPLVGELDLSYSPEEAQGFILSSLAPLGGDYVEVLRRAFAERWIDLFPTEGKRSGAYSDGSAYDVHPYMLLNYNGRYNDLSTLAHELGHTMHSWYSNSKQPFATAGYPIFVAEVASTLNEALLIEHMLESIREPQARLSLLGHYLEGIKGTLFRQTQFADFELRIHEIAESGAPLTGDSLDELYLEITRRYYGHDRSVCIVDEEIAHEWSFIPHFYYNFYVFQYATSFTASSALSEKILSGNPETVGRYRSFLSAGGSGYPLDLLRVAGVDMTTREPLELALRKMSRVMDEIEDLLPKGSE